MVSNTFCGPMKELPQQGQLIAIDSFVNSAGGCAANVAMDLAKQGCNMPEILRYASAFSASATRAVGTTGGIFTAKELEGFMASQELEINCMSL